MSKVDIKNRIKEALEIRGITQSELAEKAKIDKGQLSLYISGKYKPRQRNIDALSTALNVSEAWLMGYDVPMERKTFEQHWDKETKEFEDKINAFYYQLKSIGWTYEWVDNENLYLFTNGITSVRITPEEYSNMVEQSQEFCRRQLQKIILKSSSLLDAAHARTDIDIPEGTDTSENDIMDDENF